MKQGTGKEFGSGNLLELNRVILGLASDGITENAHFGGIEFRET